MSDDYEIGYRKPPKHSRFKRGQSGNPKGRPKKSRNLKSDLEEELRSPVIIREGGREIRVTKQRAMVKGLLAKAMPGNDKPIERVVDLYERFLGAQGDEQEPAPLTKEEQELLRSVGQRFGQTVPEDNDG